MKLLLVGDCHFRTKTPEHRTEPDFASVCLGKLKQVLDIAESHGIGVILQAGDFFDSPDVSDGLVARVIEMLLSHCTHGPILHLVHGQHDLAYHSDASRERSKLRVMEAAGAARLLGDKAISYNGVNLYGASFGQSPPRPRGKGFHILVAHAMVGDKPLWPGHELTGPADYAARHPGYNLYLLGDYHYPWEAGEDTVAMFNCGVLVRRTTAEQELSLQPKIILFDTNTMASQDILLKVSLAEKAFDLSEAIVQERRDPTALSALVEKLRQTGKIGVNFTENLVRYCQTEKVPDTIKNLILESLPQI